MTGTGPDDAGERASLVELHRTLGPSRKTVRNQVSRILDKLQVADRARAAQRTRDGPA